MKVSVDRNVCIGPGNCQAVAPEIFQVRMGVAHVRLEPVPTELKSKVQEAMDSCPVQALVEIQATNRKNTAKSLE